MGGSILNAPLQMYNGQRVLQAQATVYGEISRMNFNLPPAAIYLPKYSQMSINGMGYVDGTGGYDVAAPVSTGSITVSGNGATVPTVAWLYPATAAPSLATVFPGMTGNALKKKANKADTMAKIFPAPSDTNFNAEVDTATFLYCTDTGGALFLSPTSSTVNQLTGIGLAYFAGSLTINAGSLSSWAGVVYVNGSVYIQGPADISGILIATGPITIGLASNSTKATVEYNSDAINTAEQLLENFTVTEDSIVVTSQ